MRANFALCIEKYCFYVTTMLYRIICYPPYTRIYREVRFHRITLIVSLRASRYHDHRGNDPGETKREIRQY